MNHENNLITQLWWPIKTYPENIPLNSQFPQIHPQLPLYKRRSVTRPSSQGPKGPSFPKNTIQGPFPDFQGYLELFGRRTNELACGIELWLHGQIAEV